MCFPISMLSIVLNCSVVISNFYGVVDIVILSMHPVPRLILLENLRDENCLKKLILGVPDPLVKLRLRFRHLAAFFAIWISRLWGEDSVGNHIVWLR